MDQPKKSGKVRFVQETKDLYARPTASTNLGPLYNNCAPLYFNVLGMRRSFGDANMMKRLGLPEEIASAVLFLASDESSFATGEMLVVDGGQTIH